MTFRPTRTADPAVMTKKESHCEVVCILLLSYACKVTFSCCDEKRCRCIPISNESDVLADCRNLSLTESPAFYQNVTSIDLSLNFLKEIPNWRKLPNGIKVLNLAFNLVSNLSTDTYEFALSRSSNLETLNLSSNFIALSPEVYFRGMFANSTLKVLDLSNNTHYNESISFEYLDEVFVNLTSLEYLAIDGNSNVTFGKGFRSLKHLKYLKLTGFCNVIRLTTIHEEYFENFPFLEHLDLSTQEDIMVYVSGGLYCSLHYVHVGAIAKLSQLRVLDVSYNRILGLCGFKNITLDLQSTKIRILKANFLMCEGGSSVSLFCDDMKALKTTSLQELYLEGNNIAFAQTSILAMLPESLTILSIAYNRWEHNSGYTYSGIYTLKSLKSIDISHLSANQMSHSEGYEYCQNFVREINCGKERAAALGTSLDPYQGQSVCSLNFTSRYLQLSYHDNAHLFDNLTTCDIPQDYMDYNIAFMENPSNIDNITLENSRLGHRLPMTVFKHATLKRLVLKDNEFFSLKGPICNGTYIEYLDLSGNRVSDISTYVFSYMSSLKTLLLQNNLLGLSKVFYDFKVNNLFGNLSELVYLNLASNRLSFLPKRIFWNLEQLQILILRDNLLTDWNVILDHMSNLKELDLSGNQILSISPPGTKFLDFVISFHCDINLSHNPLQCACETQTFIKWLIDNGFPNFNCTYKFRTTANITTISQAERRLGLLCSNKTSLIIIVLCILIVIIALVIAFIAYRQRWKLRYWYYIAKRKYSHGYQKLYENDFKFDAFVSYADEDRSFVLKEIKPRLEDRENIRLCIHHRDFIPGCDIAENIINAIHHSRKVIFVITNSFLKSQWCIYELNIAHTESMISRQGVNVMVVVFKEKLPTDNIPEKLIAIMKEKTYLDFPIKHEDEIGFWEQLIDALN